MFMQNVIHFMYIQLSEGYLSGYFDPFISVKKKKSLEMNHISGMIISLYWL